MPTMIRALVIAIAIAPALLLAETDESAMHSGQGVQFDMDITLEGLDYINYNDDVVAKRGPGGSVLGGLGSASAASPSQGRSEETHPKFLTPAIMTIHAIDTGSAHIIAGVLSPILAAGSADHFETPDKFMSNRPVGRRDGGQNMRRNLGTTTISNFDSGLSVERDTVERPPRHRSAGTVPVRDGVLNVIKLPKASLEVSGYEVDLPEKQNTNRPVGRSGRGRGNSRELYPAHPNAP